MYYEWVVPDLHRRLAIHLLNVDVDGKMSIDVTHLVLVTLGHSGDHVLYERFDGPEGSNILAKAVVKRDLDDCGTLADEGDVEVLQILHQLTAGSGDSDDAGSDFDIDYETTNVN